MSEAGPQRGLKSYLATLVATILVPLLWMQALRLARQHAGADPRGRAKVLAAIAASVGIALVGSYVLIGFFDGAKAGMYDSLDARLATAVGETEYKDQLSIVGTSQLAIPKIEANLVNATDPAKRAALEQTLNKTRDDLAKAQARVAELEANHVRYQLISAAVQDQDDDAARSLIASGPAYKDRDANVDLAFATKDAAVGDMQLYAWLFLWPSLVGAFFAPLAFALGSILRKAFVPSDTVGFKPYPGAAAGLFLLFGAFGIPSIPFAAWTFHDAFGRSEEGQIAL